MSRLARILELVWDATVGDTDLDDWAAPIVGLAVAAVFGAAIGLAEATS